MAGKMERTCDVIIIRHSLKEGVQRVEVYAFDEIDATLFQVTDPEDPLQLRCIVVNLAQLKDNILKATEANVELVPPFTPVEVCRLLGEEYIKATQVKDMVDKKVVQPRKRSGGQGRPNMFDESGLVDVGIAFALRGVLSPHAISVVLKKFHAMC